MSFLLDSLSTAWYKDSMSFTFSGEQLKLVTGPGVYLVRLNEVVVYVGATCYGLGRCFQPHHRMSQFFKDPSASVEFIPMETPMAAFEEEERLICEHDPKFNIGAPMERRRRIKARYRAIRYAQKMGRE